MTLWIVRITFSRSNRIGCLLETSVKGLLDHIGSIEKQVFFFEKCKYLMPLATLFATFVGPYQYGMKIIHPANMHIHSYLLVWIFHATKS